MLFPPQVPRFDAALADAKSKRAPIRLLAVQALAAPPDGRRDAACEALRPLADDTEGAVRCLAIAALGELRDTDSIEALLAHFEDPLGEARELAVIAVGRIGGDRAVRALRRALRDERPEVRFQAVESYAEASPDDAPELLAAMLDDGDAKVREHVLDALGSLEDASVADSIAKALEDRSSAVRFAAAIALSRVGDARGVRGLIEALEEKDRVLAACEALAELRARESLEPLATIAKKLLGPLVIKAAAAGALAAMGDPRGEAALREVLGAWRADGRSYAAELAGRHHVVGLAGELAALSVKPRGADPVVVARALVRLAAQSEVAKRAVDSLSTRDDEVGRTARGEKEGEAT
jgi:HEAT repeat protein